MNQNATTRNTEVNLHPDTFVKYQAPKKYLQWHQMRQHRMATYGYHTFGQKISAAAGGAALLMFYGAVIALVAMRLFPWEILAGVVLLKFVVQILSFAQLEKPLGEKWLCWLAPVYEIYFLVANTILLMFPLKYKYKNK